MGNSKAGKSDSSSEGNSKSPRIGGAFQISNEPVVHGRTEGDVHKYEATPEVHETPQAPDYEELGQLPESYGVNTIFLIARDPRWLFTYWDIAWGEIAADQYFLKVFFENGTEQATIEINPEARNWYIPVPEAGTTYYVEIGYAGKNGKWHSLARSINATTPADTVAGEAAAEFATVPMHLTFQRLIDIVKAAMAEGESLVSALSRLQGEGRKLAFEPGHAPAWTAEQRQLLIALLGSELVDRVGLGSAEIDQLLRKELQQRLNTESASEIVAKGLWGPGGSSLFSGIGLWGPEVTSLFSGIGASWSAQPFSAQKSREFFMHVNAEVIFYGGTHPDAKVTIDGREIKLNPDGSFRYHFKFPDGDYDIPIVAVSPDNVEERSTTLSFRRATTRKGDVGHTEQPKHLKKPIGKRK
jgi:hypothetical protein